MMMSSANPFYALSNYDDREAVVLTDGESKGYVQLAQRADLFAEKIQLPGVGKQLVFIHGNNSLDSLVAYLACLRAGHVALLLAEDVSDKALDHLLEVYAPNHLVTINTRGVDVQLLNDQQHDLHSDLALLLATSGTTGSPKLVRLSYQNLQANAESICQYLPINKDDTAITALPMSYSYGLSVINSHLLAGARLAVTDANVVDKTFWDLFKQASVNSLSLVPFGFKLLKQMRFQQMDFSHLRYLTQAGGKLGQDELAFLQNLTCEKSLPLYLMYGQTEATARMAYLPCEDFMDKPGSIGKAIPGGHFDLLNEQGELVSDDNEVGELIYSGPNVMMGYAQELADLAKPSELSCLHTGDLAKRSDGFYYLAGRLNRFIKILGVRIELDALEESLQGWGINALCIGEDDNLLVALLNYDQSLDIKQLLAQKLNVNTTYIQVLNITQCPMLNNGKPNYQALKEMFDAA